MWKLWNGKEALPTLTQSSVGGGGIQLMPDANRFYGVVKGNDMENEEYAIRRLTPEECEILQGFPEGWTDIGDYTDTKGKKRTSSDAARYKALGNSICLPFWRRLAIKIAAQYERPATMGSLFDGIGGFPLVFEQINGRYTARWASEIEEFPIAVTKRHFLEPEGEDYE